MNNRVITPASYIFSAIIYFGEENFTSNDLAIILVEKFSLQKDYLKAKSFTYNQIQNLVNKGLLNKVRKNNIYQYVYSTTPEFKCAMESVELIHPETGITLQKTVCDTIQISNDIKITLKSLIDKYMCELEKISGAKEIYEELTIIVPERGKEFRQLSIEQSRKFIRTNEKLNTLKNIVDKNFH
ncbi:hypothetical protein ACG0Z5_04415 [Scandinavium sp. M-37]|uniref:hypothetical protein n=1 Tax=Scandinavium sp. M-37 TaxID=3373077 RepID=UPI00374622A9